MLRVFRIALIGIVFTFLFSCVSISVKSQHSKTKRYPLVCAKIKVGSSIDSDVQHMYGKGYFVRDEGHLGGRYYIDEKHQVTLHVEIGVDRVVESIDYSQGIHLPIMPTTKVLQIASSPGLTADKEIQGNIILGATLKSIIKRWGTPSKNRISKGNGEIEYDADEKSMKEVLFYKAQLRFHNGRLHSISIYNGE